MVVFETERLLIRNLTTKDFAPFHEMQSNPRVMEHVYGDPRSESGNRLELQKCIDAYEAPQNDFWVWAIELKSESTFVGTCAVVPSEDGDNEIGYRFLEGQWGKGFGQEVCDGLLNHLIDDRKLDSIVANCSSLNVASAKILRQSVLVEVDKAGNLISDSPAVAGCESECDLWFRWERSP